MKNFKKLFALIMTMMMAFAMMVPAFADGTKALPTTGAGFDITKNLTVPEGAVLPKETFNFTITPDTTVVEGYNADLKANIYRGVAGAMPTTVSINAEDLTGTTTKTGKVSVPVDKSVFTKPGAYVYTVVETAGTTPGMTYSTTEYKLYIYVNAKSEVTVIKAFKAGEREKSPIEFNNDYTTKDLTVTKTVTGNMGDQNKLFDFTLNLTTNETTLPQGSVLLGQINRKDGSNEHVTITAGTEFAFKLAHGDNLIVKNIPVGVEYTVQEADYSNEGYTTQIDGVNATVKKAEMGEQNVTVEFVNDNDETIETGVMLTVFPFIVGLILAASAMVIFAIRKRTRNIEE